MNIRRKLHTYETADQLTRGQLRKADTRNLADQSKFSRAMIEAGRGDERPSDYQTKDDALSEAGRRLAMERAAITYAAARFTGPGREFLL